MSEKVWIGLSLKEYPEGLEAHYYLESFASHLEMIFQHVGEFDVCSESSGFPHVLVTSLFFWGFVDLVHLLWRVVVHWHVPFHFEIDLGFVAFRLIVDCVGLDQFRCLFSPHSRCGQCGLEHGRSL